MIMSEVEAVEESQEVETQGDVDASILRNRIAEYTKQRDDHVQKAQALHGEIQFCNRMLDLMGENGAVEEE